MNMRSDRSLLAGLLVLAVTLGSCAEVQRAAEDVARQSGNPRLAGVIHGAGNVVGSLLPIGYEEESSIGQAMALQVVARYGGVVDQPELVRYVNLVARAVANTSDRPDIPYRVAILNHDSINAFAAPAGYIFVTRGLLRQIRDEAELAAVLGHEIAHVSEKHILDVIQRSKRLAGVTEAGLAYATNNPAAFKGVIDGAVKKLLDEGLDQDKETDADRVGEVFATRVGYDAEAYIGLLSRLRDLKGDDQAFFKTHPNFSARIEAVRETIRNKRLAATGLVLQERFARMTKRV
ncbi:MAG: M48 family metalloprotease [Nitrospira sp.]|nr:MAG: M48 family metalloprotease [Nitrospira sp.]